MIALYSEICTREDKKMSFFEDIDGKSGEQLSSAVLRHLLIRSPGLRTAFIDMVSKESATRPVTINDQFSCFLEQSTWAEDDPDCGRPTGRIDMVIETDDAVVGIENKFNASFQHGQPKKYLGEMQKRAKDLSELRNLNFMHLVVVLAPKTRETEIKRHLLQEELVEACSFIAWEDVMNKFVTRHQEIDPGDSYILSEFAEFINNSIGFPSYMKRSIPHLRKHWEPRGSSLHRAMRDFLWYVVPEELRIVSSPGFGVSYTGYYISPNAGEAAPGRWIWYGFVDGEAVQDSEADEKACFMLATPFKVNDIHDDSGSRLKRGENVRGWTDYGHDCWLLSIDHTWDSPEKWEQALRPYFEQVSAQFGLSVTPPTVGTT